MAYRCVATSVAGFVRELVGYVTQGYHFYLRGRVPDHQDPAATDHKVIAEYGLGLPRRSRNRRKKEGQASVQYLRYGRFYVFLAKRGGQASFAAEPKRVRDFRKHSLYFMGYAVGCCARHASVRIQCALVEELQAEFSRVAARWSVERLCRELRSIPYEPYAPVRKQLRSVLRTVNRRRKASGLKALPRDLFWWWRVSVKSFEDASAGEIESPAKRFVRKRPWPATLFE